MNMSGVGVVGQEWILNVMRLGIEGPKPDCLWQCEGKGYDGWWNQVGNKWKGGRL